MSVLDIYNMALNAASISRSVKALTETSKEAETCSLWFPRVRDTAMRAVHWNCLRAQRYPALVERSYKAPDYTGTFTSWREGMPLEPWLYSFKLPDDCLLPRYIGTQPFYPYIVAAERVLCCDVQAPLLTYTKLEENTARWDTSLFMAIVYGLASHIVTPLSAKRGNRSDLVSLANNHLLEARVADANENIVDETIDSDFILAREGEPSIHPHSVQPYGALFR